VIIEWVPERVVVEVRAAEAAARAARSVPGMARLQPGVLGLLAQLAAQSFARATGLKLPDIAGVRADLADDGAVGIELQIVIDGGYQAAAVGAMVAQAVTEAVPAVAGVAVGAVRVRIVEVEVDLG
jgi:uncharacterized alkaline shock family protein YloU